jgi:hypothetical protein
MVNLFYHEKITGKFRENSGKIHLVSLLGVFRVVFRDVSVRSDGFFQFLRNDHAGAISARTSSEQHDTSTTVGERTF